MSNELIKEFKETFDLFDIDKNEFLDVQTSKKLINSFGISVDDNEINELNDNGKINYDILENYFISKMNQSKNYNLEEIFLQLVSKKTGKISAKKFKSFLMNFGLKFSEKEADEVLNEFNIDDEGNINYKEFCHTMNNN
jgi:Ca2+-binding EF-hand superfamily protein